MSGYDPDLSFTSALLTFEFERVPKTRVPASLERFWKRKNGPCRGEAGANIVFLLGTASYTSPLDGRLEIFARSTHSASTHWEQLQTKGLLSVVAMLSDPFKHLKILN